MKPAGDLNRDHGRKKDAVQKQSHLRGLREVGRSEKSWKYQSVQLNHVFLVLNSH